ncbi:helix-turn-helix domain-containing protein [Roseobacter sp. A03A-229]
MADKPASPVFKFASTKRRRRATWAAKRQTRALEDSVEQKQVSNRQRALVSSRRNLSIARGLRAYRKFLGLSQADFAVQFGITRRALYNYEKGLRSVSGDLLERIVARGDIELSDVFGLSPEPATVAVRLDDARTAIDLYRACSAEYPSASHEDIRAYVASETANWPVTLKKTKKNLCNVAKRLMEELSEQHLLEKEL